MTNATSSLLGSLRSSTSVFVRGHFPHPNQSSDVARALSRFLASQEETAILLTSSVSTSKDGRSTDGVINLAEEEPDSIADVKSTIERRLRAVTVPVILTIASVDGLLAQFEVNEVYRLLLWLLANKKVKKILAFELNQSSDSDSFPVLFQSSVSVQSGRGEGELFECAVRHRPEVGKPLTSRESFSLDGSGGVNGIRVLKDVVKEQEISHSVQETDERDVLNKLASFNLDLKEGEKTARDKVVLPFWKEEQKARATEGEGEVKINKKAEEHAGLIHYEPDEADDWDEEDPDDDLDF